MRWLPWILIVGLLAFIVMRKHSPNLRGWALACHGAPHQTVTEQVRTGLSQAGLIVGLRGWQPSVEWINDQCLVMQFTKTTY